jgi:hypothetical protein
MTEVQVTIRGISPIMFSRFTAEDEAAIESGTIATFQGEKDTPREEAFKKLYINGDSEIMIPGDNIFASIMDAGKFIKMGRKQITTTVTSLVPAGLGINEFHCPILTPEEEEIPCNSDGWEVDSRSIVNQATRGRVMSHRPRVDDWKIKFTINFDEELFTMPIVRQLVDYAGKRCGIGVFRPNRKGQFGKFVVDSWATA